MGIVLPLPRAICNGIDGCIVVIMKRREKREAAMTICAVRVELAAPKKIASAKELSVIVQRKQRVSKDIYGTTRNCVGGRSAPTLNGQLCFRATS